MMAGTTGGGSGVQFENPLDLLRRLKLGREEYCQRLLTMLVLEGPYPRWNSRSTPSAAGVQFLLALYERCFGAEWPGDAAVFVDEFELPPRHDAERGGAPDYAVLWDDRLWLIELKTEKASHRAGQIASYFELAHHHYPDAMVDVLDVTPPMEAPYDPPAPWAGTRMRRGRSWTSSSEERGPRALSLASKRSSMASWPRSRHSTYDQQNGACRSSERRSRLPRRPSSPWARHSTLRSTLPPSRQTTAPSGRWSTAPGIWRSF